MLEFYRELQSANGPVYLKLDHLRARDADRDRERPAPHRAPEPRALPRRPRSRATPTTWSRCTSRRSACAAATAAPASGSTSTARPPCPGCTPPATWPACRTTTCSGAMTYGEICAESALAYVGGALPRGARRRQRRREQIARERARVLRAARAPRRHPPPPVRVQGAPLRQRLPAAAQDRQRAWSSACSTSCARSDELDEVGRARARTS